MDVSRKLRDLWRFVHSAYRARAARNAGTLTAANVVQIFLSIAQVAVVARILGPRDFGVATLIMSAPSLLLMVLQARTGLATVRFLSTFTAAGESRRALAVCKLGHSIDIVIAGAVVVIIAAAAPWIETAIVHEEGTAWLMILYAAALIPNSLGGSSRAILNSTDQFRLIAATTFASGVVRSGMAIGLVVAGAGVAGMVIGNAVGLATVGLAFFVFGHRTARRYWGGSWVMARIRELGSEFRRVVRFVILTDITELIAVATSQLDVILIGAIRGPTEAGLYRLAKSATRVNVIGHPLKMVSYPRLCELIDHQRPSAYAEYTRKIRSVGYLVGGAALTGVLLMPFALPLVAGSKFEPAVPAAQVLLVGFAASLTFFWLRPVYLAQQRVKAWTVLNAIQATLMAGGFPIVISAWGLMGLAYWFAALTIAHQVLSLIWLRRGTPFRHPSDGRTEEAKITGEPPVVGPRSP